MSVRLACVRHAASVRPEPGSNSLKIVLKQPSQAALTFFRACRSFSSSDVFILEFLPELLSQVFTLTQILLQGSLVFVVV